MELKYKYPIQDWVLSRECVDRGDVIAFICPVTEQELLAEVVGYPSGDQRQYITCRLLGTPYTEVINFYATQVYKINLNE